MHTLPFDDQGTNIGNSFIRNLRKKTPSVKNRKVNHKQNYWIDRKTLKININANHMRKTASKNQNCNLNWNITED